MRSAIRFGVGSILRRIWRNGHAVAVCSALHGAPCCDPDRVGQAEGHVRIRLLTASGGRRLGVLRKCRVPRDAIPGWLFLGPPVALGRVWAGGPEQ